MSSIAVTKFTAPVYNESSYKLKIALLGNGETGKTSLCNSLESGVIPGEYELTVGVNISTKTIGVAGKPITLILWDMAGQDRFDCVRASFYSGAHVGLILFDITNRGSFYDVAGWIREFRREAGNAPFVLIGNKDDKDNKGLREVSTEEAGKFARSYGSVYIETSALSGKNVLAAFQEATRLALQNTAIAW